MDSLAQLGPSWNSALCEPTDEAVMQAHSQHEARSAQDGALRTILYSAHETPSRSELEDRYVAHNDSCSALVGTLLLFCLLDLHKINIGSHIHLVLTAMLCKLILNVLVYLQHSAAGFHINPTLQNHS